MKLYRKMLMAADGLPVVGSDRNMLGVRPADPAFPNKIRDVGATLPTDPVRPGKGLSVYNDPGEIPARVAGEMWEIDTDLLPPGLAHVQRGKPAHYHIEPSYLMTLGEYQKLLADTRDLWQHV